jgi:hypothetical protein
MTAERLERRWNNFGGRFKSSGGPQFVGNSFEGNVYFGHTDQGRFAIQKFCSKENLANVPLQFQLITTLPKPPNAHFDLWPTVK